MISKYYSTWILQLFIVWFIGYICKINFITKYINPYYTSLLISIGFVFWLVYLICLKDYEFQVSFLIILLLLHIGPLYISYTYVKNEYAIENLVITVVLYLLFMGMNNINPMKVYLIDKHPSSWNEVNKVCRLNGNNFIPLCFIFKLIKFIY